MRSGSATDWPIGSPQYQLLLRPLGPVEIESSGRLWQMWWPGEAEMGMNDGKCQNMGFHARIIHSHARRAMVRSEDGE